MNLARTIAARPWVALGLAAALSLAALWPAANFRLRTDLAELLPAHSQAAADYAHYLETFGGFSRVFVLVLAPRASGERRQPLLVTGAEALALKLATSPLVSSARSGLEPADEEFFLRYVAPRAPLLLPEEVLDDLAARLQPQALRTRARRIRASVAGPSVAFERRLLAADPLGLAAPLATLAGPAALAVDPLSSSFLDAAGEAALVVLTPASSELDAEGGRALVAALEGAYAEVRRELGDELEFRAVGGPLWAVYDETLLRGDLQVTVLGSLAGCGVLMLAAFGGVSIPLAGLAALATALLWAFALVGLVSGGVSAVGVGFAAVLVGLGIDYGIHGGVRYRDERIGGADPATSLAAVFAHAGPGILTSALTTSVAFAVLAFADLRPLRDLGSLVAVGILCILFASALVGSALLVLTPVPRAAGSRELVWTALGRFADSLVTAAVRWPRRVLVAAALLSAVALAGVGRLELDADLRAARPDSHPQLAAARELAERFGIGLDTTTLLVPGHDLSQALDRASRVRRVLAGHLDAGATITSPDPWLAGERAIGERLQRLTELPLTAAADQLAAELTAAGLDSAVFAPGLEALRRLGRGEDPRPLARVDWPEWLEELVRTGDGDAWVAINVHEDGADTWASEPGAALEASLAAAAPGLRIASAPAVARDLQRVAGGDLSRLSLLALGAVALVVAISFRGRVGHALLALVPVAAGSLWALGLWALMGRALDLVSLAVVPIMLGIGIDDGLHVLHGARRDPVAGIRGSARAAGRALTLTTLTTCLGFGTLTLSHVPGLANGGLLVVLGVAGCLLATLLTLPALAALFPRLLGGREGA